MKVLLLNAGSSSLKASVFSGERQVARLHYDRLGQRTDLRAAVAGVDRPDERIPIHDVAHAVRHAILYLVTNHVIVDYREIALVIHRVVHGGERFPKATIITPRVLEEIAALSPLAPLHNPFNLQGVAAARALLPQAVHIAVFDTAYHATIPEEAYRYAIPEDLYHKYRIRKYGFHGTSHKYLAREAARLLGKRFRRGSRIITCHLGNGSSITANRNCESVDTSMGFTPTEGLLMGTRSGSLDPEIVIFLQEKLRLPPSVISDLLNHESGLKGIAGRSDMRDLWKRAQEEEPHALLALEMLAYHVKQYIGSYAAVLGGVDAIVFSGGIGENAWYLREDALDGLSFLGVEIDDAANRANARVISSKKSTVKVFVLPANEELQMLRDAKEILR